jgi:hypothetical protein
VRPKSNTVAPTVERHLEEPLFPELALDPHYRSGPGPAASSSDIAARARAFARYLELRGAGDDPLTPTRATKAKVKASI